MMLSPIPTRSHFIVQLGGSRAWWQESWMLLLWLLAVCVLKSSNPCSSICRTGAFAVDFENGTSDHSREMSRIIVVFRLLWAMWRTVC